ncbi:hypothetical protein ABIF38_003998 [Bradyrhizobium japonicum]|jgi:hypothetical protein|uniref:Uncharacterized protein n=2 Tax=Bradyrhizobium elkanii TaxID=29448 RepID=A0ABV4F8J1_BRAEL|nr:hypothetical protein [Bradyrhizobium elkanii]MCW2191735.1 hypothetical protein [Bradyrhizobium elkanii]MDH6689389.1 hypothetical protein [Bradyrhizobium elkanii]
MHRTSPTLMVCVVIFRTGRGGYGVMPATEYDGRRQWQPYGEAIAIYKRTNLAGLP